MIKVSNKYRVLFFLSLALLAILSVYNWDLLRRYRTIVAYSQDEFSKKVHRLELQKDSIKDQAVYYELKAAESQAKADSLLAIYNNEVSKARYYYEKHVAAKLSNDTLTHSERAIILRRAIAKRLYPDSTFAGD